MRLRQRAHSNSQNFINLFNKGGKEGETPLGDEGIKIAVDVRKFEIELYWKRSAYYWAILVVTFGALSAVTLSKDLNDSLNSDLILILICNIGFVSSIAWYCANLGSKFWQENWENHVSMQEERLYGPLFETVFFKKKYSRFTASSFPFSVSRINHVLNGYFIFIWLGLLISNVYNNIHNYYRNPLDLRISFLLLLTLVFIGIILTRTSSVWKKNKSLISTKFRDGDVAIAIYTGFQNESADSTEDKWNTE